MTEIGFQRIVRDCPHNDALGGDGTTKGILYDFEVLVDGEVRATWWRESFGKGYRLYAPDHEPIWTRTLEGPNDCWTCSVDQGFAPKKDDFAAVFEGLLLSNRVPTVADVAQRIEGAQRAFEMAKDAELEAARLRAIREFADEMRDVMTALANDLNLEWGQRFPGRNHAVMDRYDALRAKIAARIEELQNAAREHGNAHRGINS